VNQERSKLIQKQKQQKQELEKKVKKLKGAMKEAAQKEMEELEGKHEKELAEFDKGPPLGGDAKEEDAKDSKEEKKEKKSKKEGKESKEEAKESKEEEPAASSSGAKTTEFRERQWNGLSKKELEEECILRGLGKKGGKEDLIQKLIIFHQEHKFAPPSRAGSSGGALAKAGASDSEDEELEEEESSDDDDEDEDEEDEEEEKVDEEELIKRGKREEIVRKGIKMVLKAAPDGFPVSELAERLAGANLKGFAPEKMGYKSVDKFLKGQPDSLLRYSRKKQLVRPPRR